MLVEEAGVELALFAHVGLGEIASDREDHVARGGGKGLGLSRRADLHLGHPPHPHFLGVGVRCFGGEDQLDGAAQVFDEVLAVHLIGQHDGPLHQVCGSDFDRHAVLGHHDHGAGIF